MYDFIRGRFSHQFNLFRRRWCQEQTLPFTDVLSAERVEALLKDEDIKFRDSTFTPLVTLWAFLGQVFHPDHSCRKAVSRLVAFLVCQKQRPCAASTGAYCKARQRLPERLLVRLVRSSGDELHAKATSQRFQIAGRPVYVVDGTTVSMPDTPANQKAYRQARTQKPGVGFPIARLVALFSLASGAVLEIAVGKYRGKGTGETALMRQLLSRLLPGSVMLGDRYFCNYWTMAQLLDCGVHSLFRLHQLRPVDFRTGTRLASGDRVVFWTRPQRPAWMSQEQYEALPGVLAIRQVRVRVSQPGFRVRQLVVATTLIDPEEAPATQIAALFRARWQAELHLRSLKTVLDMDVLRCKTPEMVRKELWMHLLVYNLVREVMAQAARLVGLETHEIRFKGALQTFDSFQERLPQASAPDWPQLYEELLRAIGTHHVADRPDRYEPRAIKRRPKPHKLLTQPRHSAKKHLLRGT